MKIKKLNGKKGETRSFMVQVQMGEEIFFQDSVYEGKKVC